MDQTTPSEPEQVAESERLAAQRRADNARKRLVGIAVGGALLTAGALLGGGPVALVIGLVALLIGGIGWAVMLANTASRS